VSDRARPLVVAVTGASGGVGRATAIEFGKERASVALLARGAAGLAGAEADVKAAGGNPFPVPVDVADAEAVENAVATIERELGPIDIWVNVAFSSVFAPFEEISAAEYKRVTEVTYLGYVYCTMAVLRRMRQRGRGTVVQVGSALAYRGIPLQSAYCGAKHAIQGFNESLRCELLHEGSNISTTMVQLPALNTPQFSWLLSRLPKQAQPVPPIYQPEVAARAVKFAALHPRRREWWVGRSTVKSMIGNAVMPGLLDHYLARTGYAAQQTQESRDPSAPANLWEPADESTDFGAHGIFGNRSRQRSVQAVASRHRMPLVLGGIAGAAGAAGAALWRIAKR
jgi:NAD(P)-dependent dehydrogenase (short-subunit alcohol dehydrogenase family)